MEEREKERREDKWPLCINLVCIVIGLQPTKTRAELDSSTVLKQILLTKNKVYYKVLGLHRDSFRPAEY